MDDELKQNIKERKTWLRGLYRLVKLGQSLSTYIYQILTFLTFNSNEHPYPFGAWPKGVPVVKKQPKQIKEESPEEKKD